jgi:hypothetical protein
MAQREDEQRETQAITDKAYQRSQQNSGGAGQGASRPQTQQEIHGSRDQSFQLQDRRAKPCA